MARVLVIEDDSTIGAVLGTSLGAHGFAVVRMAEGRPALAVSARHQFDLVLIDLGLPDVDGIEVCRRVRTDQPSAVIIIATARGAEMDVVLGLEAGADDYLVKPLRVRELLARIRAHLRRVASPETPCVLELGDLVIDVAGRRATVRGEELRLRSKEFDLLSRLAREPDAAVSRDTLMAEVWDANWYGSTRTLDVHVAALRRRIGESAGSTRLPTITTLRGHGYRLDSPEPDLDRARPE